MKTADELIQAIKAQGFPCAFAFFDTPQTTPFVILRCSDSENIYSDLEFLEAIDSYEIEFYYRDPADRKTFEKSLSSICIWQRTTTDAGIDEGVMEAVYEVISA